MITIDCLADLHGHYPELEGGDLLIVAGDLTRKDEIEQYLEFFRWFQQQKYTKKVLIAGNHDNKLVGPWPGGAKGPFREDKTFYDFDYLCDSGTEFEYREDQECNFCKTPRDHSPWIKCSHTMMCPPKVEKTLKIWGSPHSLFFPQINPKCMAFTDSEYNLTSIYDKIPDDIDILISHGPPAGILDENFEGHRCGSQALMNAIERIRPRLVVFGHIHEQGGKIIRKIL